MAGEVRARMVAGATQKLAQRGLQAASFSEILELTGAPRGSIYHHFPGGKDQLVTEAVDLAGARAIELLDGLDGQTPQQVVEFFLGMWRLLLTKAHFTAGCAVVAVTVAATSDELLDHTAEVFRRWRDKLAELFEARGVEAGIAKRFATTLIAASEGAVVLSRAERSMEPFELVATQIVDEARRLAVTPET